ncbi:NAD(P)/FAD-dependent oxidoreductase [Sulfurospirillum arcachonense]|uniref:NAD(P)/FAD-dependent oxidoreductase n=1 Tax=Sulfurospirillum arcachonense TaxID=57666 RepID=UPI0004B6F46F|nr:NAD(P)/FAD-dependent oxidoreductase [Sulfurospirillum arcachonense]
MIAVIGAGASGLVGAIAAARKGAKVCIYEKNSKIGRKILATGNGRCNITNQNIELSNFHGQQPFFVNSSIKRFNTFTCKDFFTELGIEMVEGQKGRLYPKSLQSSSVVELLVYECKRLGVTFYLDSEVTNITKKGEGFCLHVNEKSLHVNKVLVATGGLAMPSLGSCDSGYTFAKNFGHDIVPTHASLVQLVCKEDLKAIGGVKVEGMIEVLENGQSISSASGDILFTNYGISGSAVLDISRVAGHALLHNRALHVKIDLLPEYSKEQLKNLLKKRQKNSHGKSVALWLDGFINSKLASFIAKELPKKSADELNIKDITKLVYALKNFQLKVTDTKGYKTAEVTAGGVSVDQINAQTLESKLQRGLYFSGEVLDIDADCGGYNLHWAWASGYCAGNEIVK